MAKEWEPKGTIKSKLLPIEIATNDYWEASDDKENPMVVDGKKRYFTWDEAIRIKTDGGWRLPTRAEWMALCAEFGEKDGDINPSVLTKALGLSKSGYVGVESLWAAGSYGYYWSSTSNFSASYSYYLYFDSGDVNPSDEDYSYFGFSARLVRDVEG